jgi:6-phosphogluconolactonase/glucosamine-6-phosphate isomerase/deaminase
VTTNAARAAPLLAETAMHTLATRWSFRAALCGGPLLDTTFAALALLPAFHRIDWRQVHLFAVDDAWDEAGIARVAACPLPRDHIHRPRVAQVTRQDAARRYEGELMASFSQCRGALPVFDFVLLAAADDGRVAGYTRDEKATAEVTRLVVAHDRGTPRLEQALPVINAARTVVLACESPRSPCVQLLHPQGTLHVLSASTARSSGAATPPTERCSRSAFPPA